MSSSTAAVVGVTLACTVILTLLALLFFCFGCRRCRRHLHLGAVPSKVPRPFIDLRGLSATSAPLPPPSISHLTNSSEMLSTQAVVAYASSSAHTSPTLPPYDVAPQETVKAQSAFDTLHPPEAVSTRPPSARSIIAPSSLPTPPAALPPGTWHAPPDSHGRALSLLSSLFSQGPQANLSSSDLPTVPRATDSGLRLYDDAMLPPPYTQD
ncbi:uncharacterized protein TRAVEDRAFT_54430 [Trametes versicolor FP-101664 SS1]|uniref:Uncharacterized protein n=1 Tax=Trametes versicolor (strain FP-101664) TaxID=717944 RepID=R7S7R4_TRAVS|nr:uncharacterized protein TRAVEDRAFT_54430 [Trametes versicolor FP-101664 SS1]EIW51677.1 hypothetical protein TRAVEDRAFT_54430 [Trametes versicolor FP-101664 SS1]